MKKINFLEECQVAIECRGCVGIKVDGKYYVLFRLIV